MARLANALRLALGGATGALEGYGAKQERLRKDALLQQQQERQREMDAQNLAMQLAGLQAQGWESPGGVLTKQQGARQAAGSAITSALQAAAGQTPTPIMGDLGSLAGGYATARPDRTITLGGQTLALRETVPEREQRLARTKTMETDQAFENAVAQLPAELQPIARASKVLPSNVLQMLYQPRQEGMTEYQREMIRLRERDLGMRGQEKDKEAKPRFGEISSLRKEFNTESRPYKTINDALKNIEALGTKPNPTPQDLQALVYQFVKVQDPTSVVRESEYANAANAAALTDKIGNYSKRILEGQTLTPRQRADMVQTARALRVEAMNQYSQLANSYEDLAGSFGMDPKTIVPNRLDRGAQKLEQPSDDAAYESAKQAIAQGASPAAVRQRYEKATGKKWPGA